MTIAKRVESGDGAAYLEKLLAKEYRRGQDDRGMGKIEEYPNDDIVPFGWLNLWGTTEKHAASLIGWFLF